MNEIFPVLVLDNAVANLGIWSNQLLSFQSCGSIAPCGLNLDLMGDLDVFCEQPIGVLQGNIDRLPGPLLHPFPRGQGKAGIFPRQFLLNFSGTVLH